MLKKIIRKKKVAKACGFCKTKTNPVWTDYEKLAAYLTNRSRISSANNLGLCAKHQRKVASAIKQARHLGLLPFITQ